MATPQNPKGHPIKAVIFDKDGTLADARPFLRKLAISRARACADILFQGQPTLASKYFDSLWRAWGITSNGIDPDGLMAVGTRAENETSAIDLFTAIQGTSREVTLSIPEIFAEVDDAVSSKAAQTPPFPGTADLLLKLSHSALKVGVLSSDSPSGVANFLRYYGFEALVDEWRGTDLADSPKPNPDLFWELCHCLQVLPRQALMIGDSKADQEVSRNAGAAAFVSVGITWGRDPLPGADYILKSWDDLLNIFSNFDSFHPFTSSPSLLRRD
jgi:phosphoglycolate phosphatase